MTTTRPLLSPEEIAVRAGRDVPFLRLPERASVFAERELRLRQLAAAHPMRDYLLFAAEIAGAQHALLSHHPAVATPTAAEIDAELRAGRPPLDAVTWRRDPLWRDGLRRLLGTLVPRLPDGPARTRAQALHDADDAWLDAQADRLLAAVMTGLDLGAAPFLAAGLQAYFTAIVLQTDDGVRSCTARPDPVIAPIAFGRTDDPTRCPCCGSRPCASIVRIGGETEGHRYLQCSLCAAQWHMVRIKCSACQGTKGIGYQSLEALPGHAPPTTGANPGAVQAETCEVCGQYLKIVHMAKDPHVEPVADDLASVTLDLLVSEAGYRRHGVNLMLLFGEGEEPPPGRPAGRGTP
jgi:FdhE protein